MRTVNASLIILLIIACGMVSSENLRFPENAKDLLELNKIDFSTIINSAIKSEIGKIYQNLTLKVELESSDLESKLTGRINNLEIDQRKYENHQRNLELKFQSAVRELINSSDRMVIRRTFKEQKVIHTQNAIKILITAVISAFFIITLLIILIAFLYIGNRTKLNRDKNIFGNSKSDLVVYEV